MDYGPGVVEVGEDDPEEAPSRATKEALFGGVLLTILSALRSPCFTHTLASPGSRVSGCSAWRGNQNSFPNALSSSASAMLTFCMW